MISQPNKLTPEKIAKVLGAVENLMQLHQDGTLGGEVMPEDANPGLRKGSDENYLYFTLPMALNYQRNSYRLWEATLQTYRDKETKDVFFPAAVVDMGIDALREKLLKHKVALQPNRHPQIWMQLCETFKQRFDGSVKNFFAANNGCVANIKGYMAANKKLFPYLSGAKIMNYWLYVMGQYTDTVFADKQNITVAPDTHVLQASAKLGIITPDDIKNSYVRSIVSERWDAVLKESKWHPIDIHTPLWLWSRSGFVANPQRSKEAHTMTIRQEHPRDYPEVYALVKAAFATVSHADGDEQDYLNELREKSTFIPALSLVAEIEDKLVGQIVLYEMEIAAPSGPVTQLVLSPVSVLPDYFRRGIARAMMERAYEIALELGYTAVFLCGDPAVYRGLGYVPSCEFGISHVDDPDKTADWCMARELVPGALDGITGTIEIE